MRYVAVTGNRLSKRMRYMSVSEQVKSEEVRGYDRTG